MATLHILKGVDSGKHLELSGERILLGRNRDCQVVIDVPAVSREHAQIVQVGGKFFIEDRESRNGTFVNNQQIKGRTAAEGQRPHQDLRLPVHLSREGAAADFRGHRHGARARG